MTADTTDRYEVERREVLGKKVRRLRRAGVLPANIFGRGIASLAVQMPSPRAREMLRAHGTNTLFSVQVAGEPDSRPVMVRAVKRNPVSGDLQHLDFYQVDLARTIRATVPVTVIGTAPAVDAVSGILIHGLDSVDVEALPADVPAQLEVSVVGLEQIDQQVTVAALIVPPGVTVHTDRDQMLARITRPRLIEEEGVVPEGEEELLKDEAAEGEPAEGEAASEEQRE